MTAVQPAASAAPSFLVIIADGKFQGVRIELAVRVRSCLSWTNWEILTQHRQVA
jgi:hypothetical protein